LIAAGERDTGAAREHKPRHARLAARADDVLCPERVDAVIMLPRPPNSGDGSDVKDTIDSVAGSRHGRRILEVALNALNPERLKGWIRFSSESADAVAASNKLLHDVLAQKAAGAGDKSVHG